MIDVIVLPTQEDQMRASNGRAPENSLMFEFATLKEVEAFNDGIGAVNDAVEYEILKETKKKLILEIAGDEIDIPFNTEAEKNAFMKGLETGDGWNSPGVYWADNDAEEFARIMALVSKAEETPAPKV
ncbi:MAG: hypothetical protein KG075_23520 [Alphaproteobacteria bacterium]|nr:hypothetical protein [Alphaproteobacteria bacterium]